jgi:hypothetical protein
VKSLVEISFTIALFRTGGGGETVLELVLLFVCVQLKEHVTLFDLLPEFESGVDDAAGGGRIDRVTFLLRFKPRLSRHFVKCEARTEEPDSPHAGMRNATTRPASERRKLSAPSERMKRAKVVAVCAPALRLVFTVLTHHG